MSIVRCWLGWVQALGQLKWWKNTCNLVSCKLWNQWSGCIKKDFKGIHCLLFHLVTFDWFWTSPDIVLKVSQDVITSLGCYVFCRSAGSVKISSQCFQKQLLRWFLCNSLLCLYFQKRQLASRRKSAPGAVLFKTLGKTKSANNLL